MTAMLVILSERSERSISICVLDFLKNFRFEILRFLTKPQYDNPPPSPLRKGGGIRGLQLRTGGG
ncbi:hypothetical protein [Helicobacter sp. T3_23-1059]